MLNQKFLTVEDVSVNYGVITALKNVSFEVNKGEIVTLIGCNGAGKTTILKTISGLLRPIKGAVKFENQVISSLRPENIVKLGISQAPEGRGIFLNLSVEENLDLGAWSLKNKSNYGKNLDYVFSLFPRLKERRHQNAGTLSGGEQQMLAIGRSLMAEPELLLLDEPSLGLAPQVIEKIFDIIQILNQAGKTILLVEQNAKQALQIAHKGIVMTVGSITLSGKAKELLSSDEVRRAYLGED